MCWYAPNAMSDILSMPSLYSIDLHSAILHCPVWCFTLMHCIYIKEKTLSIVESTKMLQMSLDVPWPWRIKYFQTALHTSAL